MPHARAQDAGTFRLDGIKDCEVYWTYDFKKFPTEDGEKISWERKGSCMGGLAQGDWTIRRTSRSAHSQSIQELRSYFHAGRPFGFMRWQSKYNSAMEGQPETSSENIEWSLHTDAGWLAGFNAPMVRYTERDFESRKLPTFQPITELPRRNTHVSHAGEKVLLLESSCVIDQDTFRDCPEYSENKRPYEVYQVIYSAFNPGRVAPIAQKKEYCPDPRTPTGCEMQVEALAAPVRSKVKTLVEASRPYLDVMYARMDATLRAATAAKDSATRPKTPRPVIRSIPDFNSLSVGALYAYADETEASGDLENARGALRALLRRFPDHGLASVAAKRLTVLQGN